MRAWILSYLLSTFHSKIPLLFVMCVVLRLWVWGLFYWSEQSWDHLPFLVIKPFLFAAIESTFSFMWLIFQILSKYLAFFFFLNYLHYQGLTSPNHAPDRKNRPEGKSRDQKSGHHGWFLKVSCAYGILFLGQDVEELGIQCDWFEFGLSDWFCSIFTNLGWWVV